MARATYLAIHADLYGVPIRVLNQAVKRNADRFPSDFMIRLTAREYESLRSQIVILNRGRGRHRKYVPFAFADQGVAMLSSVLNSDRAIQVNIAIMRVFVRLRVVIFTHKKLAAKLSELERKIENHDENIHNLFETIRHLMTLLTRKPGRIGFHAERRNSE
ncbi:MAG: ORF6N domain-containing protein [Planctomycetota bacterium]